MIQIYKQSNTDFAKNGDVTLNPFSCFIDTSTWEMTLTHPIDTEERWTYILEDAVIKAPSFNGEQLFRISHKVKNDSMIEATAKPIFFDSKDNCMLMDVRPTDKNGQQALDIMMKGTKYSGYSNITKVSTSYYVVKNLMEALSSDEDNSFLNRWGGEVLYDNYKIIINERIGSDKGVTLLYGKNIPVNGIEETVDMSDVVTRIIPKAFNGHMLEGPSPWVDSPLINKYPKVRIRTIEYSNVKLKEDAQENDKENGVIICENLSILRNELVNKCSEEFNNSIDKPKVTINAEMILLRDSIEYQGYKNLETVSKGDTIHCCHDKLGIVTDARVVDLVYDCILDCVSSVTIGDTGNDYISKTSSIINSVSKVVDTENNSLMAERISGLINGINAQLRIQRSVSKKLEARALFMEDTDPQSPLFGATAWGTSGIEFTNKRSADGSDWDWSTALNANGLIANAIVTGLLSDRAGNNYWNLDTGEFVTKFAKIVKATITDAVITGTLNGAIINGGSITGTSINVNELFIVDRNGNVTINNGLFKGNIDTARDVTIGGTLRMLANVPDASKFIHFGGGQILYSRYDSLNERCISLLTSEQNGHSAAVQTISGDSSSGFRVVLKQNGKNTVHLFDNDGCSLSGNLSVSGSMYISGTKNRLVKDFYEGNVLMNAVESAVPVFEDYGTARINENGKCVIRLERRFLSTVNAKELYFTFLTPLGKGTLFVKNKYNFAFIVQGTPNLSFDWRVTVKQKGFENHRMEEYKKGGTE